MIRALILVLLCFLVGYVIYRKGVLNLPGTLLAVLMAIVISFGADVSWLFLLLFFLILGFLSTRYGYEQKGKLRLAEKRFGMRSWENVLANGLVPTSFALLWYLGPGLDLQDGWMKLCYIASVATVTGDTLSSEIGVLSKGKTVLITTLKDVPKGTDGGVSILGELAGAGGALLIGISAYLLGIALLKPALVAALAGGIIGFHVDSLLGALLERRKMIGNATVNFLSALMGSAAGLYATVLL